MGAAVAGVALSSGLATALVGSAVASAIFPYATEADALAEIIGDEAADAVAEASAATEIASAAGGIAGTLIFAVTTAVLEGIDVANAGALPGQLASLIVNAHTTAPAVSTLISGANGASSLFSLFVGATLPMPLDDTCDNYVLHPARASPFLAGPSPTALRLPEPHRHPAGQQHRSSVRRAREGRHDQQHNTRRSHGRIWHLGTTLRRG